jgi:hypothetical protein
VARTLTFEAVFKAGFAVGYVSKACEADPISLGTTVVANTVNVSEQSPTNSHPFIPVYGRFRDDPTWERFMQNIEEYDEHVDALERTLE